jgi:O-antigen ligase
LSSALLIGAIALQLLHERFRIRLDRSLIALLVFAAYLLLSGLLVAYDYSKTFSTVLSFLEYLGVFYLVVYYIQSDNKPDFPMYVFIIQAIAATLILILNGVGVKRVSIAENVNVNTIGVTLTFAIGFVLYLLIARKNSAVKWGISITAIAVLLIGVLLTVSKKAIIGGAALIILWTVLCYRYTFARIKWFWKLFLVAVLVFSGILIYRWYTSRYALQMEVFMFRMSETYVGDSDQERIELFKEGLLLFLSHPFFGVGFNNARYYTSWSTYTHCLYSEMLACTGIIGTLIFGYTLVRPWVIISRKRESYKRTDLILNTRTKYLLAIFVVFFAISFTTIAFYAQNLMYIVAVVAGYAITTPLAREEERNAADEKITLVC